MPDAVLKQADVLRAMHVPNGCMYVLQVTARAKDPAALPAIPSSPADTIASARIPAASPTGSQRVQTATLVDVDGRAAGKVSWLPTHRVRAAWLHSVSLPHGAL